MILAIAARAQSGAAMDEPLTATPMPTSSACPVSPTPTPTPTSSPTVSAILFAPAVVTLDNPSASGSRTDSSSFSVSVTAYDNSGNVLEPSVDNPLFVEIERRAERLDRARGQKNNRRAAPRHSNTPADIFPKPINVESWMRIPNGTDASLGRYALGITQILGTESKRLRLCRQERLRWRSIVPALKQRKLAQTNNITSSQRRAGDGCGRVCRREDGVVQTLHGRYRFARGNSAGR